MQNNQIKNIPASELAPLFKPAPPEMETQAERDEYNKQIDSEIERQIAAQRKPA